jgi:hypothetical protein
MKPRKEIEMVVENILEESKKYAHTWYAVLDMDVAREMLVSHVNKKLVELEGKHGA